MKRGECDNCPHRGIDGGPGAVMVFKHPGAPDEGRIIRSESAWNGAERILDRRYSVKCPLPKEDE